MKNRPKPKKSEKIWDCSQGLFITTAVNILFDVYNRKNKPFPMRKNFLLTAPILILVALSGCAGSPNVVEQSSETFPASAVAQNAFDTSTYSEATNSLNSDMCGLIGDEKLKNECISVVANEKVIKEAVDKAKIELCQSIKDEKYSQLCMLRVKAKTSLQATSIQKQKDLDARQEEISNAVASGDASRCKELKEEDVVGCEYNIYTAKAMNTKDDSLCKNISDSTLVNKCIESVELAKNPIPEFN